MLRLRQALVAFYRIDAPTTENMRQALSHLQRLVQVLKDDGMNNMEMSFCFEEQANLLARLGDREGFRAFMSRAASARVLCLGISHPSSREALAKIPVF